jgi:hypothetical protein
MVIFIEYYETMVSQKPEWRRAFIDWPALLELLKQIKCGVTISGCPGSVTFSSPRGPGSTRRLSSENLPALEGNGGGGRDEGGGGGGGGTGGPTGNNSGTSSTDSIQRPLNPKHQRAHSSEGLEASPSKGKPAVDETKPDAVATPQSTGAVPALKKHHSIHGKHGKSADDEDADEWWKSLTGSAAKSSEHPNHPPGGAGGLTRGHLSNRRLRDVAEALHHRSMSTEVGHVTPGVSGTGPKFPDSPALPATRSEGAQDYGTTIPPASGAVVTPKMLTPTTTPGHDENNAVTPGTVGSDKENSGTNFSSSLNQTPGTHPADGDITASGAVVQFNDVPRIELLADKSADEAAARERPGSFARTGSVINFSTLENIRITDEAVDAAEAFETLLISEAQKASRFVQNSVATFRDYLQNKESHILSAGRRSSKSKLPVKPIDTFRGLLVSGLKGLTTGDAARVRDNLKYLYRETEHLLQFIETNALVVKTALMRYHEAQPFAIREELQEANLLAEMLKSEMDLNHMKRALEVAWAEAFSGGSITAAMHTLSGGAATSFQAFKAGFFSACIFASLLYWLHLWFELNPDPPVHAHYLRMFPVMRLFICLFFSMCCWSGVLYVCRKWQINYLYVFEFSQLSSISWMKCYEYGVIMLFLACLSSCLYVRSEVHKSTYEGDIAGFQDAAPYFFPLLAAVFIITLIFPPRQVFRRTRDSFFAVLWSCCKLPWGDVKFVDFFVADWGTSLPILIGDVLYTVCYYTSMPKEAYQNDDEFNLTCDDIRAKNWFLVALIPYFWRACQTIKMYLRTKQRLHLVNHGKYLSMMTAFVLMLWNAWEPSEQLQQWVWTARVISQLYAFVWDILMDWGWIRGYTKRGHIFKHMAVYWAAAAFDFAGRLYFVPFLLYVTPTIGNNLTFFIQASVEIVRRSMWSVFRLENENLNNLETYRRIDFVPKVVVPV